MLTGTLRGWRRETIQDGETSLDGDTADAIKAARWEREAPRDAAPALRSSGGPT